MRCRRQCCFTCCSGFDGGPCIAEHKNKVARHDANGAWSKIADIHGGGYLLAIGLLLVMAVRHKDMAVAISDWKSVTPYFFFEIVFPAFLLFGFWFLYNIIKKQQRRDIFAVVYTGRLLCGNILGLWKFRWISRGTGNNRSGICCCIYSVWTKLSVASDITGGSGSRLHRLNDSILHQKDGEYL